MGVIGGITSWFGRQLGAGSASSATPLEPATPCQIATIFGPPPPPTPRTHDRIISDLWIQPWRGPLDLDREGGETVEMRDEYRTRYRDTPVLRAAIRGKADAISCLEVTVLPADADDERSSLAAEFVAWCGDISSRGWRGIIDTIYTPACLDGWSLGEKKLEAKKWKGRWVWGPGHIRGLDSRYLRLQLDQYRNILSVVNLIRGVEYFSAEDVVLFSLNPLFNNPFGQSDVRAVSRSANILEDVYRLWYLALKLYGLPLLKSKTQPENRQAMATNLAALREAGYIVTGLEEEVEVVNMASAAATDGFEKIVHTMREDTFFAIRGAAQPFMEGDGGADAHTDTGVQKASSDATEYAHAKDIEACINEQIIPFWVTPNFGPDCPMPRVKLGGTNWKEVRDIIGIIKDAQDIGLDVSKEAAHDLAGLPPPRDDEDKLVSAQEKQQQAQQQQGLGGGGAGLPGDGGEPPGGDQPPSGPSVPDDTPPPSPDSGDGEQDTEEPSDWSEPFLAALGQATDDGDDEAVGALKELGDDPDLLHEVMTDLGSGDGADAEPATFSADYVPPDQMRRVVDSLLGEMGITLPQTFSAEYDPVTFAAPTGGSRPDGQPWEGKNGRWFVKKNGRVVPAKNPNAQEKPKGGKSKPQPQKPEPKKSASQLKAEKQAAAKAAVAKAIADPKSLTPSDMTAVAEHLGTLTVVQKKEFAKQVKAKVSGTAKELGDRLLEHIRKGRDTKPKGPTAAELLTDEDKAELARRKAKAAGGQTVPTQDQRPRGKHEPSQSDVIASDSRYTKEDLDDFRLDGDNSQSTPNQGQPQEQPQKQQSPTPSRVQSQYRDGVGVEYRESHEEAGGKGSTQHASALLNSKPATTVDDLRRSMPPGLTEEEFAQTLENLFNAGLINVNEDRSAQSAGKDGTVVIGGRAFTLVVPQGDLTEQSIQNAIPTPPQPAAAPETAKPTAKPQPPAKANIPADHDVLHDHGEGVVTARNPKTGEYQTHFPPGMPEREADRLIEPISEAIADSVLLNDGYAPTGHVVEMVRASTGASVPQITAALSKIANTQNVAGHASMIEGREMQEIDAGKQTMSTLPGSTNSENGLLWMPRGPMAHIMPARPGMVAEAIAEAYRKEQAKKQ